MCVVLYFALFEAFKAPRCLDPSDKSMVTEAEPPTNGCEAAIEAFLASVEMGDPSAADHLCQMAAVKERLLGYGSIQPAYYSASIAATRKPCRSTESAHLLPISIFSTRNFTPYSDSSLAVVVSCELIEHLLRDPLHMLLESGRVLESWRVLKDGVDSC